MDPIKPAGNWPLAALLLAMVVIVLLLVLPGDSSSESYPNGSLQTNTTSYTKYSGSGDYSWMLWVTALIGIPLLMSFKPIKKGLFGTGGIFRRPRALIWFIIGFFATEIVLMAVNPDPATYEFPPLLYCSVGGIIAMVVKGR